jgi:hypothetical protein
LRRRGRSLSAVSARGPPTCLPLRVARCARPAPARVHGWACPGASTRPGAERRAAAQVAADFFEKRLLRLSHALLLRQLPGAGGAHLVGALQEASCGEQGAAGGGRRPSAEVERAVKAVKAQAKREMEALGAELLEILSSMEASGTEGNPAPEGTADESATSSRGEGAGAGALDALRAEAGAAAPARQPHAAGAAAPPTSPSRPGRESRREADPDCARAAAIWRPPMGRVGEYLAAGLRRGRSPGGAAPALSPAAAQDLSAADTCDASPEGRERADSPSPNKASRLVAGEIMRRCQACAPRPAAWRVHPALRSGCLAAQD